jgi:hypothetical protein
MEHKLRRRTLAVLAAGVAAGAGGCLSFGNDSPVPGSLRLENDTETVQAVSVRATKVSDDDDDPQQYNETPDSDADTRVVHDDAFELSGGDRQRIEGWLFEPGLYFLEADAGSERTATEWIGLYSSNNGTSVGEETVWLTIEQNRIWFGLSVSD